ncbi:hypothetical protein B566_EDAN002745 [Ephemera danica]|nr:hypothetical protein B566_EDAN002745 [Ephemera danica]
MGRPQRKATKPATTGPKKDASSSKQQTATTCIKCAATSSLVNLKQDIIAQELFVQDELEPGQSIHACISCSYHASLVAQLQSALQDQMKRPTTSCLVCRSSGRLQELHSLEGCKEGLMNPIIQSPHVTSLISNSRKLCIPCAYSIQWLHTHSLESKPNTRNSKAKPNKPETKIATKRVKELSPPPEPRSKRGRPALQKPQVTQNQKTKKPPPPTAPAPRSLRKRVQTPSSSEEEEEEEPPKKKTVPVTTNSRVGRVSKPPERLNATQLPLKLEIKNKANKKTAAKPPAPQRASQRSQRVTKSKNYAETDEPIEVTCSLCSEVFNSRVELATHELEHNNRTLQIILTRCKESEEPDSSAPYQQFSSSEDDDLNDKQRSRRKNKSPKKNLARDEVTDENDKRHNFVFVSPVLVSNQKKTADPTVTFSFEKPIACKDIETSGDFSEEEPEESDNVTKCITSLENETKDSDDAEKDECESTDLSEKETLAEANPTSAEGNEPSNKEDLEKSVNEEKNQNEEPEIDSSDTETAANGHQTSDTTESPVLTSSVLKFDFDDSPKKSTFAVPQKNPLTVNSILSFDYEAPVKRVSDGSKSKEQDVGGVNANVSFDSTEEGGDGTPMDPNSALREDSVNPTLPQTQDSDPNCSFSSVDSRANESAEFTGLEKIMSEVVGEN